VGNIRRKIVLPETENSIPYLPKLPFTKIYRESD